MSLKSNTTSASLQTSDDQDERHKLRSGLEHGVRGHVGVTPDDVNGLQNTLRPLSGDGIRRSGALWVIVFHNTPYIYGLSARGRDALSAARTMLRSCILVVVGSGDHDHSAECIAMVA